MRNLKLVMCAFALMALFAGLVPAATITYPPAAGILGVYSVTGYTDWDPAATPTSTVKLLALEQFNPAWGTLLSVSVTWDAGIYGNSGPMGGAVDIHNKTGSDVTVDGLSWGADMAMTSAIASLAQSTVSLGGGLVPASVNIGPGAWYTSGPQTADMSPSGAWSSSGAADLAAFTGLGTFDLAWTAFATSTHSAPSNVDLFFDTVAKASATVTYEFRPVPEPSTFVLLGGALCGLALWGRKRIAR